MAGVGRFRRGQRFNDAACDGRGSRWLDALLLDSQFSLRMLLKLLGLTLVATFAMAVTIAVGTTTLAMISGLLDSALPFPDGESISSIAR